MLLRIFLKILSCCFRIPLYLFAKLSEIGKLHFGSYKAVELNSCLTAVKIAGIVKKMAFNTDSIFIADSGAYTDIGNGHMGSTVFKVHLCSIDAVAGNDYPIRKTHVYGGGAHLGAEMIAGVYSINKAVGVTQITAGLFHIALSNQCSDVGGAYGKIFYLDGTDNINAYATLLTIGLELKGIALALMAEGEVMTADNPADI